MAVEKGPNLNQSGDCRNGADEEEEPWKEKSMAKPPTPVTNNRTWFTPKRLLIIFCIINLINYLDRGAIASNGVNGSPRVCSKNGTCSPGSGIQGNFNLTNFEDGVVSSAFMVGLLVASPIFASAAKSFNPFRLIGVGLAVWTVAVAICGFSFNFWSIAIARMFVGVGEASFISLAAPFIDDNAPTAQRTMWLGAFYMCIPTGVAVGYVYGGMMAHYGWRWAFRVEALIMLPFVILGFVMKPLDLKGFNAGLKKPLTVGPDGSADQGGDISQRQVATSENSKPSRSNPLRVFWRDLKSLLREKVFVVNVLGYIAYNFVIGAYSYWGPKAGYNIYHMKNADYMFGGVTAVCGILGSLIGGFVLDSVSSTISNAFKLLSFTTLVGAVFCFGAFCLKGLYGFLALFAIGELLVFATQAPVNFVCLHCVKPSLRPLSMAMSTVCIHVFGDVPSSPLVGLLQDHIHNWRATALILTSILFIAAAIWFIGIFFNSVDRSDEDESIVANPTTPLEKTTETT
ncbi:probable sphingolipid transporter spinster homolog 2 [Andrographis paniculata]|uniref:probable sphingolipid transporter spinster homolog 2 n=1 Tax=Andrographis paniculata TaxID=175694 RepID=UPI0021E7DE4E|nr:probable sphingolipid transporter spinster homolog 2 [Andrographis paniculata]